MLAEDLVVAEELQHVTPWLVVRGVAGVVGGALVGQSLDAPKAAATAEGRAGGCEGGHKQAGENGRRRRQVSNTKSRPVQRRGSTNIQYWKFGEVVAVAVDAMWVVGAVWVIGGWVMGHGRWRRWW